MTTRRFIVKTIYALLAVVALLNLGGCNTFEGAGKDIERGGEKIQDTAKDVKKDM
jgi:entericidin B